MSKVNCLRITSFYVGETGKPFKQLMIVQELFRNNPKEMKGIEMKMLHKVPRFKKWTEILEQEGFVEQGFFQDKVVMVDNYFYGFSIEHEQAKQKYIDKHDKTKNIDSRFPVSECVVVDLSSYVTLESYYWSGNKQKRKVSETSYRLIKVGEVRKPDNRDFCKLLALESYQRGEWKAPPPPEKKWRGLTVRVLLELSPDSAGSGAEIDDLELAYVDEGGNPEDIMK